MSQEMLHQYDELAQQAEEIAARLDNEPLSDERQQAHAHFAEHEHSRSHRIEIKEGHACGADCPDHGGHGHPHEHEDHHEVGREHTIATKPAEHACVVDCPEHGDVLNHEESHSQQSQDHHIESRPHMCAADCPEHNHTHDDHHPQSESQLQNDHHIKTKAHSCGADCPEHSVAHSHDYAEVGQQEPAHTEALAYQKAEEAMRRSQRTDAQIRAVEPSAPSEDIEVVQGRAAERAGRVGAYAETKHIVQDELHAPIEQLPKEACIPEASTTSGIVLTTVSTKGPPESLLASIAAEIAGEQPGVTGSSVEIAAHVQLPEAEIISLAETSSAQIIEQMSSPGADTLSDEAAPAEHPETISYTDVANIETVEPLGDIDIPKAELPMAEPAQTEQLPEAYEGAQEVHPASVPVALAVALGHPKIEQEPASGQAAEGLAELVRQRIEVVEYASTGAPLRAQAIQKALYTLAELQAASDEVKNAKASQQLLHLLRLLGYENPARTLKTYIHQYGEDFESQLRIKLLELLSQGRVYEGLPISSHAQTTLPLDDRGALGVLVLALAQMRGYLLAVASSA